MVKASLMFFESTTGLPKLGVSTNLSILGGLINFSRLKVKVLTNIVSNGLQFA